MNSAVAPDLVEPFLGWRVWRVARVSGRWRLFSLHYRDVWPEHDAFIGTCHLRDRFYQPAGLVDHEQHRVPAPTCACGVYAARELELTRRYVVGDDARQHELAVRWHGKAVDAYLPRVVGRVRLWGDVVEAAGGFRASHAYPDELWLPTCAPTGHPLALDDVALDLTDYGVPVELVDGAGVDSILAEVAGGREHPRRTA